MSSQTHTKFSALRVKSSLTIASLLLASPCAWSQPQQPSENIHYLPTMAATRGTTSKDNPKGETYTGRKGSGMGTGEEAAIAAGILGAAIGTVWAVHHFQHAQENPEHLFKNGPKVPESFTMSHFIVDGIIGPNWPVALDFQIEGHGSLTLDIITSDKVHYRQVLTNDPYSRGIVITHPDGLPDKLQSAVFDIEAVAPAGSNGPPPTVQLYGMAVGPKAVGSIGIDHVQFGPPEVKTSQDAQYGFHSHSDFSNVRADFMFTAVKDNHIVVKQENETPLSPVGQEQQAQGLLTAKGTPGNHLLQIRAWRGNAGDWVVAWSPDEVMLTK